MVYLCTQKLLYNFICYYIYVQQQNLHSEWGCGNGLATRSSVGKSFYGELETVLIPNLRSKLPSRRHFVNDSLCFVKTDFMKFVLDTLNNFCKIIKFVFEKEIDRKILFLDGCSVSTKQSLHSYNSL